MFGTGEWAFNQRTNTGYTLSSPPWKAQLNSEGMQEHQIMSRLMRSREFYKLKPDLSNTVMTFGSSGGSVCAKTSDGQTVIAYIPTSQTIIPTSQTITIDMTKITDSGSEASCNWYNPRTGAVTNFGTFATSGTRNFTSPDSQDWVLVVDSNAAHLRLPGT
jgi:hypothetical protein